MDLTTRGELVPNLRHYSGGQDRRSAAKYAADLAAETDRSLRRSPRWRAGLPLLEEERWPTITSADLGGRSELTAKTADRNAEHDRETARERMRRMRERRRNGGQP